MKNKALFEGLGTIVSMVPVTRLFQAHLLSAPKVCLGWGWILGTGTVRYKNIILLEAKYTRAM